MANEGPNFKSMQDFFQNCHPAGQALTSWSTMAMDVHYRGRPWVLDPLGAPDPKPKPAYVCIS